MDNELIYQGERFEFAKDITKKRGFIRARYANWQEPRNGLIAFACKDFLNVLFLTGINQCATYYKIKAKEVQARLWDIIGWKAARPHINRIKQKARPQIAALFSNL